MFVGLKKNFFIFIVSCSLVLGHPITAMAAGPSADVQELQILLNLHLEMKSGIGSLDLINNDGQKLLDQTATFLARQRNLSSTKNPDLIELEKHQKYLANYFELKNYFATCVQDQDKDNKRQLSKRILDSACQSMLGEATGAPCQDSLSHFRSLIDFNALAKITQEKARPAFQDELSKQILLNTARALAAFKYKFDPDFMSTGRLEDKELDQFVNQICTKKGEKKTWIEIPNFDVCQNWGSGFRQKLTSEIRTQTNKLAVSERKFTPEAAMYSLNRSLDRLNEDLKSIEIEPATGFVFSKAKIDDPKIQSEFDYYQNNYFEELEKEAGVLLLTKSLKEKTGALKNLSEDTVKYKNHKNQSQFRVSLHGKVRIDEVKAAMGEAQKKILEQLQSAQSMAKSKAHAVSETGQRQKDIKDMARLNPVAAGQVLIRNPEYKVFMCEAINDITAEDASNKKMEEAFILGSTILSVTVLAATTGGLAAMALGTAIKASRVAVSYGLLGGSAVSLSTLGFEGNKSLEKYKEINRIESVYLSKNSDRHSFNEARDALVEYKKARASTIFALLGLGVSAHVLAKAVSISKSSNLPLTPEEMRSSIEAMKATPALGASAIQQSAGVASDVASATGSQAFGQVRMFFSKVKEKALDRYEWIQKEKIASGLRKQGKSKEVAAQEAESMAKVSRQNLVKRHEQCRSKTVTPAQILTQKRYMGISLGLSFAGSTYGYSKANGDKLEENKLQWFSKLGYELVLEFLYTKLNVKTTGSQSSSLFKKYLGLNWGGAKIGAGDAVVYSGIYGANEEEARLRVDAILRDPEALKELRRLDAYIEKTNFVQLFENHLVETFRKIINSPEKEVILGKPPYDMGDRKFSSLSNEDLDRPEVKAALVRAALMQMNSGELGALLSTGDMGVDKWLSDRSWGAKLGVPRTMMVGALIYLVLCMGSEYPVRSLGLAAGIQFLNQILTGPYYYDDRKKTIGL